MVVALESLPSLNAEQLRELVSELIAKIAQQGQIITQRDSDILYRQAKIDKLTHELVTLKRWKFGRSSEQLNGTQISLIEETIDADIAAIEEELKALAPTAKTPTQPRQQPKRTALPAGLPRVDIHHEPDSTTCQCGCQLKRIGEDVSEKLDYTPGVFTVEQHIRGKWACSQCETLTQAPVPAQIIDKGIPTAGLLAQVLVAKYGDHLPLYRQEYIFGRAGVALPRSTLAQWVGICGVQLQPLVDALKAQILSHSVVHADETPVQMLKPGNKKTHRSYLWAYAPGAFEDLKAVVYDFCESRAGEHCRTFLGEWRGSLVCDDYAGYKAGFASGITEAGCMAHSRRKFFDLHVAAKSQIAGQACAYISQLYDVEREVKHLSVDERLQIRQAKSKPLANAFQEWMLLQRQKITDGSTTAKALDYSLKRWGALTQFLDDGQLPIDNNWIENQIRPIAIGRNNANGSLMRTRLRRRAILPSVEAPTASLLLRMITVTAGTASTPWAGSSELA
ncbi:MAG: IS66 family transposase [Burkholderiales bacterium]|nr:IS66 family transposase [Burkholderiales bacterium]